MTQVEQKYKVILTAKQAELSKTLNNRGEIGIESNPDVTDEAQQAGEREIATRFLNDESYTLKQVNLALKRIEEGTFGICTSCDEELPPKRLYAVPWAPLCIACQMREEHYTKQTGGSFSGLGEMAPA